MLARINELRTSKKLGIVIHAGAALFTNGITQNATFMYECFMKQGISCEFLCQEKAGTILEFYNLPIKWITEDRTLFDPTEYHTIISVTRQLTPVNKTLFTSNGVYVISFICGNSYPEDQQQFVYGRADKQTFLTESAIGDEMWIIPSLAYSQEYYSLTTRKPVYIVPHAWHPKLVKQQLLEWYKKPESSIVYNKSVHTGKKINILIMEPNLSTVKTSWIPILGAEKLHTLFPDLIDQVYVFCFPEHPHAYSMVSELKVDSKIRKFKRLPIGEILPHFNSLESIPIVVCHQVLTTLNYAYYEMLHYGYPLVHNSPDLDKCGYYYNAQNISECAQAILSAYRTHNANLEKYMKDGARYLERCDPYNADVGKTFMKMLNNGLVRSNTHTK
jgi:hypothetical protein